MKLLLQCGSSFLQDLTDKELHNSTSRNLLSAFAERERAGRERESNSERELRSY
jgi:hypothetical protein